MVEPDPLPGGTLTRVKGWNEKSARLFAADCAEHVLLAEREAGREPDERSWAAVEAARQYALGKIDSAAHSAAYSAAYSAAVSAAYHAADSAAYHAARSAERDWQYGRFLHHIGAAK